MELLPWGLVLTILVATNYWAGRALRPVTGTAVLVVSSLPAVALVSYTGFRLAYAIVNLDEVTRRFQHGDRTYFGADMAFGVSFPLGCAWVFVAYAASRWGRSDRRSE